MDLTKYFRKGLKNTLRLNNGTNFSFKGPWVAVEPNTVLDSWYVGDFMAADYTIIVDISNSRKQMLKCSVLAGPDDANIVVYGSTSLTENLIEVTATVNSSFVNLIINPSESPDGSTYDNSTLLDGAKVIFSATYYETVNQLTRNQPSIAVDEDDVEEDTNNPQLPGQVATYSLTAPTTVNEGASFDLLLTTTGVDNQTAVPYTITGAQIADIEKITSTFTVTVQSYQGANVFLLNGNLYPSLILSKGHTYIFNQNDASNLGTIHPLILSTTQNGTHAGGTAYESGVVYKLDGSTVANANAYNSGFAAATTRSIEITVASDAPSTLYYYCYNHSGMNPTGQLSVLGSTILDGVFTIFNNRDTNTFTIAEDLLSESTEQMTINLSNGQSTASVSIIDTTESDDPAYLLTPSSSSVNEGDDLTITLTTTDVDNDTEIPYTISGVGSADIDGASLTGNFTITDNEASVILSITEDLASEGLESLTLSLDNGEATTVVSIVDTSQAPSATYELSADETTIDEGDSVQITLTTTNVNDGTSVPYVITGISSSDLSVGSISGSFVVNSNTASLSFTLDEDATTEGTEIMTLSVAGGEDTIDITVGDTSTGGGGGGLSYTIGVTAPSSQNYSLSGTDRNGAVSGLDPTVNVNAGDTLNFNVSATGHPFYLKTVSGTGTGNQVSGATNNGAQNGTVSWTPNTPGTYYYQCSVHSLMVGQIVVS